MMQAPRRRALTLLGTGALSLLFPRLAAATLARGLTLPELSKASRFILLSTPLESTCRWLSLGGSRRIVTETRLRIEDVLAQSAPAQAELWVTTLGGVLGDIGEVVPGEAQFALAQPCVVFLRGRPEGPAWVTGMAQGHFPLRARAPGALELAASPHLPQLLALKHSAARQLAGQKLSVARALIRESLRR